MGVRYGRMSPALKILAQCCTREGHTGVHHGRVKMIVLSTGRQHGCVPCRVDKSMLPTRQGYNEVIICSDNLENVILLGERKDEGSSNALIRRIQQILSLEDNWVLTYVPREINRVADALAKISLSSGSSLRILESPPSRIKDILQDDISVDNSFMNHFL
ncbi:hypothetical protein PVK06_004262 [Gossypium arboreum]|uniref:RNase H type-1 domain-containing protein n=1 Tax=Gossypium arboreum TaxID=29729 RepID=A0ABR0QRH4_GOSAR|nr:hypothetical protein PVK06_004262 [Gossypium arboreum]